MKILHVCLASFYIDNYSYQENLLAKFHKKLGYDVEILASLLTFNDEGRIVELPESIQYVNEHNIPVKRLEYKKNYRKLRRYKGTKEHIENTKPDIIFIHGCQFLDIDYITKYISKHPDVKVYVDNHADYGNSAQKFLSKNILHKIVWRLCARKILPYTTKFYGVLPNRVDFLKDVYKIPSEKIELLVMGADDDEVTSATNQSNIKSVRKKFKINKDDFLIVTGGKINKDKLNVFNLMHAVKNLNNSNVKLIVFGSVTNELKEEMKKFSNHKNIQHIGWLNSSETYKILAASDLVVFPDKHSVLWEQVVPLGIPLIVSYIKGATHIDIGGNCLYLYKSDKEEIQNLLDYLLKNNNDYLKIKRNALKKEKENFLYSKIAENSISSSE